MEPNWIIGIQHVWFGISLFLLLLLLICRTSFFRQAITAKEFTRQQIGIFIILFSVIGLCGTYWNVRAGGGIINFRAVGIILGGFVGGPIVGTAVGTIVGIHRAFFINTDSSFIHGGLSIIQGIAAGFLSYRLKHHYHNLWFWSFLYAFILEFLFWIFFAFLTWPTTTTYPVNFFHLSLPIIATNTIAVSIFYLAMEFFIHQRDSEKTQTTKSTFNAVITLFSTLHDGFKSFSVARVTEIMTTSLPSLIWAAILYNDQIYTRTNYKDDADKNQGDAEIAILKLQHSLPDLPHLITLPVKYKGKVVGSIFAAKSKGDTFTNTGTEFLHGICHILESIYESEKLKEEENLLAEAEIRALQAQINPHFLYNTLDALYWRATNEGNDEIAEDILSLSQLFRHVLGQGNAQTDIGNEKELLEEYLHIQKMRFSDHLDYEIHMEEAILSHMIPKLILQPFVENAVVHGFERDGGDCLIRVDGKREGEWIVFTVEDNGVGMSEEQLQDIWEVPDAKRYAGQRIGRYAIRNVKERLELLYGDGCTLRIESAVGRGTCVTIRIPWE